MRECAAQNNSHPMFLDAWLPNGVLENIDSERLFEKLLSEHGQKSFALWSKSNRLMKEKELQHWPSQETE